MNGDTFCIANKFNESVRELQRTIESATLKITNKIYIKTRYNIKPDFKAIAVNSFHSDIENVNFAEHVKSTGQINQWVESKTNGKILNLIDPGI